MDRLESYRSYRRFGRWHLRSVRILSYIALGSGLAWAVSIVRWKEISTALQAHSAALSLGLAATLVLITGYYAFMTAATLREMKSAREASVRPVVKIRLDHFVARNDTSSPSVHLESLARIANYGRGAAIDVRLNLTVPWKREAGKEELVRSSIGEPIPALQPGSAIDVKASTYVNPYQVNFPEKAFFEVDASFEDIEAQYYEIKQFYDLHPITGLEPDTQEWRCHLSYEDLRLVAPSSLRHRRGGVTSSDDKERVLVERS